MSQGKHKILDDVIYMAHGNWPCERITRRRYPTGEELGVTEIPTTSGFLPHDSVMYDKRTVYVEDRNEDRTTALMRSDVSQRDKNWRDAVLFMPKSGERMWDAISTPEGILIALYNTSEGSTRFVLHQRPNETLFEKKGQYSFVG